MKPLEEEIQSILRMLSRKHPILKGTVNDCTYVINNSSIDINFNVIISQIFKDLKYDREIQEIIKSIYGKTYQINFYDNITWEEQKKINEAEHQKNIMKIQKEIKTASIPPKEKYSK